MARLSPQCPARSSSQLGRPFNLRHRQADDPEKHFTQGQLNHTLPLLGVRRVRNDNLVLVQTTASTTRLHPWGHGQG